MFLVRLDVTGRDPIESRLPGIAASGTRMRPFGHVMSHAKRYQTYSMIVTDPNISFGINFCGMWHGSGLESVVELLR
jgi:hypothetical protein